MAIARKHSENSTRFPEQIIMRCPATFADAIDRAAAKHMMTSSEYARRKLIERLRAEGIDPAEFVEAGELNGH